MPKPSTELWPRPCERGHATPGTYLDATYAGTVDNGGQVTRVWVCRDHAAIQPTECSHTNATSGLPCPWCFMRHD